MSRSGGVDAYGLIQHAAEPVAKYLPDRAGILITQSRTATDSFGPWIGLGLMAAWVAAAIVGAWIMLRRRDA